MKRETSRLRGTAVHEAAHAVAAIEFQLGFHYVTVAPDDDSLGHIRWTSALSRMLYRFSDDAREWPSARDEVRLGYYLSACLAGNEAEKRLKGRYDHVGARGDHKSVVDATSRYCGSLRQEEAFIEWRRQAAADLVELRWTEIVRVADALLERGRLSRQQVESVMWADPPGVTGAQTGAQRPQVAS